MRSVKILISILFLAILASNVRLISYWSESRGVYDDIWKYDRRTLRRDLSAHLLFGATTATAFSLMTTPTRRSSR